MVILSINRGMYIGLILTFIIIFSGYTEKAEDQEVELKVQDVLNTNTEVPQNGIAETDAIEKISYHLREEAGLKGDFSDDLIIKELTTKELWQTNHHQIFRVEVGYAWLDGLAIFKDKELEGFIPSMDIMGVYLADCNKDQLYEIYLNSNFGSGSINSYVIAYDTATREIQEINLRKEEKDIILEVNETNNSLDIYYRNISMDVEDFSPAGYLSMDDNNLIVVD